MAKVSATDPREKSQEYKQKFVTVANIVTVVAMIITSLITIKNGYSWIVNQDESIMTVILPLVVLGALTVIWGLIPSEKKKKTRKVHTTSVKAASDDDVPDDDLEMIKTKIRTLKGQYVAKAREMEELEERIDNLLNLLKQKEKEKEEKLKEEEEEWEHYRSRS